jgi:hypothetical protein
VRYAQQLNEGVAAWNRLNECRPIERISDDDFAARREFRLRARSYESPDSMMTSEQGGQQPASDVPRATRDEHRVWHVSSEPPAPRFTLCARSIGPLERLFAGFKDTSRHRRAVVRDVNFDAVGDEPNETGDFFAFTAKRPQTRGLVVYHVGLRPPPLLGRSQSPNAPRRSLASALGAPPLCGSEDRILDSGRIAV